MLSMGDKLTYRACKEFYNEMKLWNKRQKPEPCGRSDCDLSFLTEGSVLPFTGSGQTDGFNKCQKMPDTAAS